MPERVTAKIPPQFRMIAIAAAIVAVSLLHYLTPLSRPMLHDIFQRLYYLPIIVAAFWFGLRGGLFTAIVVSIAYAPHILFQWGGHHHAIELEKYLEIVLYNVVGGVTGFLSQQGESRRAELADTAAHLGESFNKLQAQSEMIIGIEEQLRHAERLSALGEMSAVLAHEIRNPLGSIRGAAEILKDDYRPGDRKYEFLEILVKESERLNRVVEDFLQMARPKGLETGSCDIMKELTTIVTLLHPEADAKGVRLELNDAHPPPLSADSEKLRQAFLNIIINALQACMPGGTVRISTSHTPSADGMEGKVEVLVSDTGHGIAPDQIERIFTPFFTTKKDGTGLGLPIAKRIIEGHGGRLSLESRSDSGTTFTISLPAAARG